MMELRRVTADILTRYDISLAPGQTESAFLGGGKDFFFFLRCCRRRLSWCLPPGE